MSPVVVSKKSQLSMEDEGPGPGRSYSSCFPAGIGAAPGRWCCSAHLQLLLQLFFVTEFGIVFYFLGQSIQIGLFRFFFAVISCI